MPSAQATDHAAETSRDWTCVPATALAVVSKHATTRTTPGGCRLARICRGWRSAVRHSGPVVIKRGASIGASLPMCTSLSQWLGSNGAGVVCLQLQGLPLYGSKTTSAIISGLHRAASAAAAAGVHLQLHQLALDGDSLLAAMRLMPLLPNLKQLELSCVNLPYEPDKEISSRLQQLQEHKGITCLTFNIKVTQANVMGYGSLVTALLLQSACPQQVQDLTLRWHLAPIGFGNICYSFSIACSIYLKQLVHLKQLRKLTLDQVGLQLRREPGDTAVDADPASSEVVSRLEQVSFQFPDVDQYYQQLDPRGLPALLPKLVELHATRPTFTDMEVLSAATNLTSIRVGAALYEEGDPQHDSTKLLMEELAALQDLQKLVLPKTTSTEPYSMDMLATLTRLEQLQDLSLILEPGEVQAVSFITNLQRLTSLSLQLLGDPLTNASVLWNDDGLTRLTGLQHLEVQATFLAAGTPAALEKWTALTSLTLSFNRSWQQQVTEVAAVLSSCPGLQQRLRVVYATYVMADGVRKVYRALRRALPRTRVEVLTAVTGPSVPEWLREAS